MGLESKSKTAGLPSQIYVGRTTTHSSKYKLRAGYFFHIIIIKAMREILSRVQQQHNGGTKKTVIIIRPLYICILYIWG